MKVYTFEIVIQEGKDEFWENLEGTGCDVIQELLFEMLQNSGFFNSQIVLRKFENSEQDDDGT